MDCGAQRWWKRTHDAEPDAKVCREGGLGRKERERGHRPGSQCAASFPRMEEILSKEEEHADDMADLLFAVEPATGEYKPTAIQPSPPWPRART